MCACRCACACFYIIFVHACVLRVILHIDNLFVHMISQRIIRKVFRVFVPKSIKRKPSAIGTTIVTLLSQWKPFVEVPAQWVRLSSRCNLLNKKKKRKHRRSAQQPQKVKKKIAHCIVYKSVGFCGRIGRVLGTCTERNLRVSAFFGGVI